MNGNEPKTLTRDVEAAVVPVGTKVTLQQGEQAYVAQALGGSYTVVVNGNMFRIEGKDADALGFDVAEAKKSAIAGQPIAAEELELLRKQGNDFINAGDFAGARGVLERAADAGDAASALALAATYDPAVLARFKVRGLMPDNAKAAQWYERARDLGSQEAPLRLNALARGN